jgi:hypothetical protein
MVLAPCRAFSAAARWNGQPAHSTTGVASSSAAQCTSAVSGIPGSMVSTSTRADSGAATTSRRR